MMLARINDVIKVDNYVQISASNCFKFNIVCELKIRFLLRFLVQELVLIHRTIRGVAKELV